jgi:hypothetical protein
VLAQDPYSHVGWLEDQMGERLSLGHPHHCQGGDVHPLPAKQLPEVGQRSDPVLKLHHHLGQHPGSLLQAHIGSPGLWLTGKCDASSHGDGRGRGQERVQATDRGRYERRRITRKVDSSNLFHRSRH